MSYLEFQDITVVIIDAGTDFGQQCAALFVSRGANLVANFPPRPEEQSGAVKQVSFHYATSLLPIDGTS